jgi:hypothetical protein
VAVPLGLVSSVCLTTAGFVLQTWGLKDGNTVVVCTCAAVSSMVMGVLVGLLALGEGMPAGWWARTLRMLSWLLIAVGVTGLANGSGAARGCLRRVQRSLDARVVQSCSFFACRCRTGPSGRGV